METFNSVLLAAHVTGGLLALAIALVPMVARKGGAWHVRAGRIYSWAMMWVLVSALVLSCTRKFIFFLVGVTVLSFYDTFTGVRCLYQKGGVAGNARGQPVDWAVTAGTLLFGGTMAGYGLLNSALNSMIATLTVLFGVLILNETIRDVWRFFRPSQDPKWWWYYHMERMMGSWIAGVTALAVNQIGPRLPGNYRIWVWIAPAILITLIVVLWVRYYRKKFAVRKPAEATPLAA